MSQSGIIEAIYVTHEAGEPMAAVDSVEALKGRGLDGDRYCVGTGYYSPKPGWGANVTLIQSEAIDAINKGYSADFSGAMLRRNIVTSKIKLESLIGCKFQCGTAILFGTKPFPPCAHLAYLLGRREVLKYFAHCGGIGATVVADGEIRTGDLIKTVVGDSVTA